MTQHYDPYTLGHLDAQRHSPQPPLFHRPEDADAYAAGWRTAAPMRPVPYVQAVPQQWYPPEAHPYPVQSAHSVGGAPPRRRTWPWVLGGALGVLVLLVVLAAIAGPSPASSGGTATSAGGSSRPTPVQLGPAEAITAREWQLIAKDPAAHVGERIVVYGVVTQFDTATGTKAFRANVDGVEHKPEYGFADYVTNTILTGDEALLASIVQDDLFKAEVTVAEPISYDTAIGGSTTAPSLTVTKIDLIGRVD